MAGQSVFAEDWRDCLRAHYRHVVQQGDGTNEQSLRGVMYNVGFETDELKGLYIEASARADDVPDSFTPDLEFLEAAPQVSVPGVDLAPEEGDEPAPPEEAMLDDQPADDDPEQDDFNDDEPPAPPPSDVQQLSLF
jgi:hypothetical protein